MKTICSIALLALTVLLTVTCGGRATQKTGDETAETTESIDSVASADMPMAQDAAMYGLIGAVRQVLLTTYRAVQQDGGDYIADSLISQDLLWLEFNQQGQVLRDHLGNIYSYAADGSFMKGNHSYTKLTRDGQGRLKMYDDNSNEDREEDFNVSFDYDDKGRLMTENYGGWTVVYEAHYTYDADDRMTVMESAGSYEGGGMFESRADYGYKKFDEQGNWTERLVFSTYIDKEDGENPDEPVETIEKTVTLQKATYRYF
jgi:hypothetical protein